MWIGEYYYFCVFAVRFSLSLFFSLSFSDLFFTRRDNITFYEYLRCAKNFHCRIIKMAFRRLWIKRHNLFDIDVFIYFAHTTINQKATQKYFSCFCVFFSLHFLFWFFCCCSFNVLSICISFFALSCVPLKILLRSSVKLTHKKLRFFSLSIAQRERVSERLGKNMDLQWKKKARNQNNSFGAL